MKKTRTLILGLFLSIGLASCLKTEEEDVETMVELTIYPETISMQNFFSDIWTESFIFTDSESPQKISGLHTIFEGIDMNYERGYEYKFKAKKTLMRKNPPQDVSNVKYELLELLNKEKKITEDKTEELEITVFYEKVKFQKSYPYELDSNGKPIISDALLCIQKDTNYPFFIQEIKDFSFETGYQYVLKINKITKATPYSVTYELIEQISKEAK